MLTYQFGKSILDLKQMQSLQSRQFVFRASQSNVELWLLKEQHLSGMQRAERAAKRSAVKEAHSDKDPRAKKAKLDMVRDAFQGMDLAKDHLPDMVEPGQPPLHF